MYTGRKRYEWQDLELREGRGGLIVSELKLHADEYLYITDEHRIIGPTRVIISYREGNQHSDIECLPLSETEFDYDNPLEYPCDHCGASRGTPCVSENPACTYRVFTTGGVL
jgi:hypothetical protein